VKHEPEEHGTVKTSTILIGSGGGFSVYRRIEEVPSRLRGTLVKSTAGSNAGTVLIADRRGAQELLRANVQAAAERGTGCMARFLAAVGEDVSESREFLRAHWRASALIALAASALLCALAALRF
jgi:hypothetical protein